MSNRWETLGCRAFQAALKVGNCLMGYRMPECLEGAGKVAELGAFLRERKMGDALVVTGSGMMRRGQLAPMLRGFEENGIRYVVETYDATDPTSEDVERGYRAYREHGCRMIVAVGGGSRIDCAKAIAARVAQPRKGVAQLQGLLKVHRRTPCVVAIPTTAGAGSETTVAAVITDAATHRKASINDPFLIPHYAVLDPEMTVGLPPFMTAITGMDALTHAVEAYTNRTYNTELEDRLAREAVKRIHDSLPAAFADGSDLAARQSMQRAAFCAGRAFTRGCVGYVHAIGHALGSLYSIPHGLAMAVLLPHVLRRYGPAVHGRLAELADVCGIGSGSAQEKAGAFIEWIEAMNRRMGLPEGFDMIREEDIPQIIAWALKEANPLYPVPVVWDAQDMRSLLDTVRR